jgi:hypothetical protein
MVVDLMTQVIKSKPNQIFLLLANVNAVLLLLLLYY